MLLQAGFRASAGWFGFGEPTKWHGYGSPARTADLDPNTTATSPPAAPSDGKSPLGRFSDAERLMLKVINGSKKPFTVQAANSRFVAAMPANDFRPQTLAEAEIVLERLAKWGCVLREEGDPVRYRRHDH